MKSSLTVVLFWLFTIGVFVDGNEESVSVTEGDSVTLKSGVTEIQTDDEIEWWFSERQIAKISRDDGGISLSVKPDGSFKDRLQLDSQTGDLKISNIRTTDSGEYKLQISSPRGSPPEMTFTVKVVPVDDVKSVSVLEGDSVTLQTSLTHKQRDAVIQWRFDHQKSPVAEINRTAGIFNTYDGADGRFRDRLQLDHQTGSLIIKNMRNTHSGLYEADIIRTSSKHTIHKTFNVTVSDDVQSVSVLEGDSVTLHTDLTKIQTDDQIVWKFGDQGKLFPRLNDPVNKKWTNTDLNLQTGDLTIRNIRRYQHGDYKVEINTRTMILHRKYRITIIDAVKSVFLEEGETVTLQINVIDIQKDDLILWMFGDIVIAEISKAAKQLYNGPDGRFRDRLKLDHQTGSLIITNTRTEHTGLYEVKISSR
ncbi:uncharacterized protein LOC109107503 [Cyprinus carpio]|uniref:Uncharacterized protein LOC109107503 n=1 Tax=Cyprinus carpio TaxID=7962 RepID=A0A9Q9XP49_CYPCA|nr:uncharacterized protein LOC109107503 [Cyprinus carpio]